MIPSSPATLDDLRSRLHAERTLSLTVRCQPGAKAAGLRAILADGSLKIGVRAKAEDGRANDELLDLLNASFPGAHASLLAGQTSRRKLVKLTLP
jgi:uncharacterized protein YggU (UPF0235/DUF167 family)